MLATFHLSTSDLLQNHPPASWNANPSGSDIRTRESGLRDHLIIGVPDIGSTLTYNMAAPVFSWVDGWTVGLAAFRRTLLCNKKLPKLLNQRDILRVRSCTLMCVYVCACVYVCNSYRVALSYYLSIKFRLH